MNIFWIGVGGLAGVLFVLSQWLTLIHLPLNDTRKARRWVVGGAFVRLSLLAGLFVSALWQGVTLMMMVFFAWWLARWLTLYNLNNGRPLAPVYLDITEH